MNAQRLLRSSQMGLILWLLLALHHLFYPNTLSWIDLILLLGPLSIVPLGFSRILDFSAAQKFSQISILMQATAASAVLVAFLLTRGIVSALLTMPWLFFTAYGALRATGRILGRKERFHLDTPLDIAQIYLAIGAAWLTAYRLGFRPLDFEDSIVQLTAVHFHYAGFAAPLLANFLTRSLTRQNKVLWNLSWLIQAGILLAMPLTAAGITFSPLLEWLGTLLLISSLSIWSYLNLRLLTKTKALPNKILLGTASVSILAGMTLALLYAYSAWTEQYFLSIDFMARFHGTSNALGFALAGLCEFKGANS